MEFSLHPDFDIEAAALNYRAAGRVSVAPLLHEGAADGLLNHLVARSDWQLNVKPQGRNVFRLTPAARRAWSEAQLRALRASAGAGKPTGFHYAYESIPVVDAQNRRAEEETPLAAFAAFLSSPTMVEVWKHIVGDDRVGFAELFASRYRAGDFLSIHEDRPDGVERIAAFVLGFTRAWRPEWGGLLLFHDKTGEVRRGLMPGWNSLTLFSVPQDHSVSQVASFAPAPRLSLTGWLYPRTAPEMRELG